MNYVTYRNDARGETSHGQIQHAQNWVKFGRIASEIFKRTDRQTYTLQYFISPRRQSN